MSLQIPVTDRSSPSRSKRIEGQISSIQEKSEAKKMEV